MLKKENIKLIVGIVVLFAVLAGAYLFLSDRLRTESQQHNLQQENMETSPEPVDVPHTDSSQNVDIPKITDTKDTATLEINGKTYHALITTNTSVYDFMDSLRKDRKISFTDKTYIGMGKFIEAIDGIQSDGDRYWIYYVNGKKALIGVSNYKINPGDVVSWKFEKDID